MKSPHAYNIIIICHRTRKHLERTQYKMFLKLLVYNGSPFCSAFPQFALFPHHFNLKIHHNLDLVKIVIEGFGIEHIYRVAEPIFEVFTLTFAVLNKKNIPSLNPRSSSNKTHNFPSQGTTTFKSFILL